LGSLESYGFLIRGIWYLLAVLISAAIMLLVPRCKMKISVLGERTLQVYITHIWIRNALVYGGFFAMVKNGPGYLAPLVLFGSIPLTFLLSSRLLKRLYDLLMAPKLFKKILKNN
jgi:fucose 4-O-acetylase-like acetyltransferase